MKYKGKEITVLQELRVLPSLTKEEEHGLAESIVHKGFNPMHGKILLWIPDDEPEKAYIIDGYHRWTICQEQNIELTEDCFDTMPFKAKNDALIFIAKNQLNRRNLNTIQKIELVNRVFRADIEAEAKANRTAGLKQNAATENLPERTKGTASERLAKMVGISEKSYRSATKVLDSENEELKEKLRTEKLSINAACKQLSELTKDQKKGSNFAIKAFLKNENTIKQAQNKRHELFDALETERVVKFERSESFFQTYYFYIEVGKEKVRFIDSAFAVTAEAPNVLEQIPRTWRDAFTEAWKLAQSTEQNSN